MKHMIENNLLSDKQHGFVPGRSCVTQLLEVLDAWTEVLDCGGRIDAVYLDFAKAFDTVLHQRLLVKLRSYGVDGAVHGWIEDFLDRRNQRVCLLCTESAWARVKSGVPQGSVLGPVLFICYINDLVEQVSSSIYMYADDTKIFRAVSGDTDTAQLQADLDAAVAWSLRWQLHFNETKCKVMEIAGKKKDKVNRTYLMGDGDNIVELENSDEERDLGILVDRTLSFNGHIEKAIAKANQILGLIKRTLVYFDRDTLKLLYCSLVRPHLEYANVVWHPQYKNISSCWRGCRGERPDYCLWWLNARIRNGCACWDSRLWSIDDFEETQLRYINMYTVYIDLDSRCRWRMQSGEQQ
jgi:hypothetical protein